MELDYGTVRFYVMDADPDMLDHIQGWFGVVDEEMGSIFAWFNSRMDALAYADVLNDERI